MKRKYTFTKERWNVLEKDMRSSWLACQLEIDELNAQLAKAEEALRFYASQSPWFSSSVVYGCQRARAYFSEKEGKNEA
jgi:hypothetical protein